MSNKHTAKLQDQVNKAAIVLRKQQEHSARLQKPTSCDCGECKAMCMTSPCLPTPGQVAGLVERYGRDRIKLIRYVDAQTLKIYQAVAPVGEQSPYTDANGKEHLLSKCTFFNDKGLCSIHDHKPLEGKLSHHTQKSGDAMRRVFLETHWRGPLAQKVLREFGSESFENLLYLAELKEEVKKKRDLLLANGLTELTK